MDSKGNTLDFLLSAKRDERAAKRFFRKALKTAHNQTPRVININHLVRNHLKLVRYIVNQYQPLMEKEGMIVGKAALETKFKIQDLEVSSRTLKNLQEVGRRAVSEPVAGVREVMAAVNDRKYKGRECLEIACRALAETDERPTTKQGENLTPV